MRLSIIIPIYNEKQWLLPFWERMRKAPIDSCPGIDSVELIVVDDGSTDGTSQYLLEFSETPFRFVSGTVAEIRYLAEPINRGKGNAVRQGIKLSTGDIVILQDADLEYSPLDYPALLSPFIFQKADAVLGSRFVGHPRRVLYFWHSLMNKFLTLFSNMLNNINITDMESGYKVIRGEMARRLHLTSERFGIEPELMARLSQANCQIYEVPISYQGRTYREGKKIRARDGMAALYHILRFGLWDTDPFQPGLMQTLNALESVSDEIYAPLLKWALSKIPHPEYNRRILEVGAGTGTLTQQLLSEGHVVATDISPEFVKRLQQRYSVFSNFEARLWDAGSGLPSEKGGFDIIVACNVLEHIEQDISALKNWLSLLVPGGYLVLIVPNHAKLYSAVDKAVGHFRRYTPRSIASALETSGFTPLHHSFGNPLGILGWLFYSVLLQRSELPMSQLRLYAFVKPLIRLIEKPLEQVMGINLVVVAKASQQASKIDFLTD